jgi:transcriptional regulator with XRE-family HTH domain
MRMGLSQAALGQVISVTFQQIQKYGNGKNSVAARQLFCIGQTLRAKVSTLFEKPFRDRATAAASAKPFRSAQIGRLEPAGSPTGGYRDTAQCPADARAA